MNELERRQELGEFLRIRRSNLSPTEVGLPNGARRRTPGLRREEVAFLANIGTSWYTSLEQGRDVHPSVDVLESLARALRLSPVERDYLFSLTCQLAPPIPTPDEEVSPALQNIVHTLNPNPAYVMGKRWDVLVWNAAAEYLFNFSQPQPPHSRNLVWRIFTNPTIRTNNADWEHVAQSIIAEFRADSSNYPRDAIFASLIADLQEASPIFRLWWSRHEVYPIHEGHKKFEHPVLGLLEFEHITLQVPANPGMKLMIYSASPETAHSLSGVISANSFPINAS